jgi:hypothetical protein
MRRTKLLPVYFSAANEREKEEFFEQLLRLKDTYLDVAVFLDPVAVGNCKWDDADAVVFPQLIGAAFRETSVLKEIKLPFIILTSKFGTVEMWDWEIVAFLRDRGMNVFSPYSIDLAKTIIRAVAVKKQLAGGARFLMFQDSPGEGMQANIFKRFYWWEQECIDKMENLFGVKLIYKSWKEVSDRALLISDQRAKEESENWNVCSQGVDEQDYLNAVRIYVGVKEIIEEIGGVEGVGSNCLNESFNCFTTPCLAWNMIFEKDNIIWACEGDVLTLLSTFIIYRSLECPVMMTNIYPFLVGMAALAHEKIDKFPEIEDPDNHALGVHCGYFGFAPRSFCTEWTLRPKVLEIVNDKAIVIDCRMPKGAITLAKIEPNFNKLILISAEIEDYVQYPGSDCRNGALIHYKDGHKVMDHLSSHHMLVLTGNQKVKLMHLARIFEWEVLEL